jgi:hypothetical protein
MRPERKAGPATGPAPTSDASPSRPSYARHLRISRPPFDDLHTCIVCFGPISRGRCLFCHAAAGPKVFAELEDGTTTTATLGDLLRRQVR